MSELGWSVYLLLALLLIYLYRASPSLDFLRLMELAREEHLHVLAMINRHPRGGTWRESLRWMQESGSGH